MILVVAALCMTISTIVLAITSVFEEGGGDLIFHQKMKES